MKRIQEKPEDTSEKIAKQTQEIIEKRGTEALEIARKTILQERIECKEIREALHYFMTEYWHDLARPALLSLACEAVGGDPDITTPIAVPMILISGAIDIHDDIIDQSEMKRNRPTVLGKFGKDMALLVGDALLFRGFALLAKVYRKKVLPSVRSVIDTIKDAFFELGDAEALELQFRGKIDLTPEQYLSVVRKKAADVESYTRVGAILGGGSKSEVETLGLYGRLLGELLILRDDLVDTADRDELSHRARKEHLPLPILYALQSSKSKSELRDLLSREELSEKEAEKIFNLAYKAKGIRQHGELMEKLIEKAGRIVRNLENQKKNLLLLVQAIRLPYE